MLETIDLTRRIKKAEYQKRIKPLELKMGELQRRVRELGIPVIVVFEGWGAAGKGTLINTIILSMDPRGFKVFSTQPPTQEEFMRPFLWRFWTKTPERGRIALFDRSWYGRVLGDFVEKTVGKNEVVQAYDDINSFERQLVEDGTVIVKYFLHISKKEQKKRFEKLSASAATAWRVTKEDWRHLKQYTEYAGAIEEMLAKTGTAAAPWTVVEAHDHRFATVKCFSILVGALQRAVDRAQARTVPPGPGAARETAPMQTVTRKAAVESILDRCDLSLSPTQKEYDLEVAACKQKIWDLEHECYRKRLPVAIVFEGWDASGKGGAIKRLAEALDPRGYEVNPFSAPNDLEKQHHYLWRFWLGLPKAGHITIFDRSWYGRVLVERVEGFCREDEWQRAYQEIDETEQQWAEFGMVVIKFWLHIDRREQLKRFQERKKIPAKQWKITPEDWRNREKWNDYKAAVDEMLIRTDRPYARWTVVEANSKLYARIKVLKTVIKTIEGSL